MPFLQPRGTGAAGKHAQEPARRPSGWRNPTHPLRHLRSKTTSSHNAPTEQSCATSDPHMHPCVEVTNPAEPAHCYRREREAGGVYPAVALSSGDGEGPNPCHDIQDGGAAAHHVNQPLVFGLQPGVPVHFREVEPEARVVLPNFSFKAILTGHHFQLRNPELVLYACHLRTHQQTCRTTLPSRTT